MTSAPSFLAAPLSALSAATAQANQLSRNADRRNTDSGSIDKGSTVDLAYVDQSRDALADDKTVWEEISDGLDIMRIGKHEIASRQYCGRFNFKGTDQQKFVGTLSGGERNRAPAKLLRRGANVLLLDELPTTSMWKPCARWRRPC